MVEWKEHVRRAVALKGSQAELAAEMARCGAKDISQSKISWLLVKGDALSAEDALAIDRATQGEVSASEMRPDLWPTRDHVPSQSEPIVS